MEFLLLCGFCFYFIYTLLFAIKFNTTDNFYTGKRKLINNILIWLVPFIWILLLKSLLATAPGSAFFSRRRQSDGSTSYESGLGIMDSWNDHSGNDFGGGDFGGDSGGDGGGGDGGD